MDKLVKSFFACSEDLDRMALRPLSHIMGNWDLSWDNQSQKYIEEENSLASTLNLLIDEIARINPPVKYHDNEDRLVEYAVKELNWSVTKTGRIWNLINYPYILERGSFIDINQSELCQAVAGRVRAAIQRAQNHFDEMEEGHQKILASVISIILYHRN